MKRTPRFAATSLALLLAVLLGGLSVGPHASVAGAQAPGQEVWEEDPTFTMTYLGRDNASGTDRYQVSATWGATFFGIAVGSMPLEPADGAVSLLLEAFTAAYPSRAQGDIRPGDAFEFRVPVGTLVGTQWRSIGGASEFRSFLGDRLIMYTSFDNPLEYRLVRAESPNRAEIKIRRYPPPDTYELATALYGGDDPEFKPDFLQVVRATRINSEGTELVTVDTSRDHLDDLRQLTGNQSPTGTAESGLDVYWIRATETAQPVFRVDDGIRDSIDFSTVPRVMRVYYYKNGVVRTYQRAEDTLLLSGRQPQNGEWADVFAEYGRANPMPTLWGTGQPEEGMAAEELRELGITVLRYYPQEEPPGNIFASFLQTLLSFIRRDG